MTSPRRPQPIPPFRRATRPRGDRPAATAISFQRSRMISEAVVADYIRELSRPPRRGHA